MKDIPEIFVTSPVVFAAGKEYRIFVPVREPCIMGVRIAGKEFYDASNGVANTGKLIHHISVPYDVLNGAKEYTVFWYMVFERNSYVSKIGDEETWSCPFRPVPEDDIHIYHLADAHYREISAINCAKFFGDRLDLLILNGDIFEECFKFENFFMQFRIIQEVTGGEIPVVCTRGNHDMRGQFADQLTDYIPTENGNTYYTFRVGSIFGIVLDTGEDKPDDHPEYSHFVQCHPFRLAQTEFLKNLDEKEYNSPDVKYRIVISHNPFTEKITPPFDIEPEIFTEWCRILGETVKPDFILCGHMHSCYVTMPGTERDSYGQPCPVAVASDVGHERKEFLEGGAITLNGGKAVIDFTDDLHNILEHHELDFKK